MAKDIVKKEEVSQELASAQLPDFMKGERPAGTEALSSKAMTPPRLKLCQATTPEKKDNEALREGQFFNNTTGTIYGKSVLLIPIFLTEAYFLFAPKNNMSKGGLLARANDGVHWSPPNMEFEVAVNNEGRKAVWKTAETVSRSKLDQWGTFDPVNPNSPPAAVHSINMMCLMPEFMDEGPSVFSFMKSAIKIGKKLSSSLSISRAPAFGRLFRFSSLQVSNTSGQEYYEPRFEAAGFVASQEIFNVAKEYYEKVKDLGVQVDVGEEDDPQGGNSGNRAPVDDSKVAY